MNFDTPELGNAIFFSTCKRPKGLPDTFFAFLERRLGTIKLKVDCVAERALLLPHSTPSITVGQKN